MFASCFWLFKQLAPRALPFAFANAGKSIPAKIAIMAITTSSSIRVKPFEDKRRFFIKPNF